MYWHAGMGIRMGAKRTRLYGLNLSRCLGDKFLKDQDLGLSAVPHVSEVVCLEPGASAVVVLASDGLWDVADGEVALKVRPSLVHPAPLHVTCPPMLSDMRLTYRASRRVVPLKDAP